MVCITIAHRGGWEQPPPPLQAPFDALWATGEGWGRLFCWEAAPAPTPSDGPTAGSESMPIRRHPAEQCARAGMASETLRRVGRPAQGNRNRQGAYHGSKHHMPRASSGGRRQGIVRGISPQYGENSRAYPSPIVREGQGRCFSPVPTLPACTPWCGTLASLVP
jgi:hypothetical protein